MIYIAAVLLVTSNLDCLVNFYKNTLRLPLKKEQHGDTYLHYGCNLGTTHFAIHPTENFSNDEFQPHGSIRLAFAVEDMNEFSRWLDEQGVMFEQHPSDAGFGLLATLRDPDGNIVEIVQLFPSWLNFLQRDRAKGNDLLNWHSPN